jgi:hypothetical protein
VLARKGFHASTVAENAKRAGLVVSLVLDGLRPLNLVKTCACS